MRVNKPRETTASRQRKIKLSVRLCAALSTLLFMQANVLAAPPVNPETRPHDARDSCTVLAELHLEAATGGPAVVTSARLIDVPANGLQYPSFIPSGYGDLALGATRIHQYCNVTGYVAPQNKFVLKLPPLADWNHKFFFYACGGFCGSVLSDAANLGLARGYASVTGNGGHESQPPFDGIWAANAPELQDDFGWRSNHVVALIAKAITAQYYGSPINRAYMVGNSKGGQAVLMEAQRFPGDFDGLMPSAPVYDYTGRNVLAGAWIAQSISDGYGGSVLNAEAAQAVHKSVLQHCGAQAGVEEQLVTDPLSCSWQPDMAACTQEGVSSDCLNAKQVVAIKRLMSPVTNSRGEVLAASTYLPGTETEWLGWNYLGSARPGYSPRIINLELTGQYLKYLADNTVRGNADALTFNFDTEPATLSRARRIYDATSFDLRAFKARGGKILMWHGWADGAIMATSSIAYYEGVIKAMGGLEKTQNFFRLFLVPGVHHGGGGPGLTQFDSFSALEDWMEKGRAPDKLLASLVSNGIVERTRPIYPYPVLARYSGKGDPTRATSFLPFEPPLH